MNVLLISLGVFFSFITIVNLLFISVILEDLKETEKQIEHIYIILEQIEADENN